MITIVLYRQRRTLRYATRNQIILFLREKLDVQDIFVNTTVIVLNTKPDKSFEKKSTSTNSIKIPSIKLKPVQNTDSIRLNVSSFFTIIKIVIEQVKKNKPLSLLFYPEYFFGKYSEYTIYTYIFSRNVFKQYFMTCCFLGQTRRLIAS